ncbi:MAG TPA: RNA polymerase sigma factor [Miltoncostaea sp.]|nr:RNA polymerase sigma factor [Miltoncostaea sp.]
MAPGAVRLPAAGAHRTTDARPDDDLAGRIAAGDARAFEALYARHRAEISRYCATLVRNPQDAEEAFQLTMLAAYRALSTGRGPRGALRPWLFRIAHNECVDLLRGRPQVEPLTDRHPVNGLLQERVEARETLRQLSDDIAALPLRQRAAFVLHEIEGLSHAAIGEALGTTDLDARRLLHEARTSLGEFHAGRALECSDVRVRIGAGDRRTLRSRGISAHLRDCAACRDVRTAVLAPRTRRRRLLVAATAVLVAGMVAVGVRAFAAAPASGPDPASVPAAASPAPLTPPPLGTAPVVAAPAPAAPVAPATAAPAPAATPPEPSAPDPVVRTVQEAPAPPPAVAPVPAPPPAVAPVVVVDPSTGEPSALTIAPPEEAEPPPTQKPEPPSPERSAGPTPAPEPEGEVAPPEATPAPEPGAPEAAPAPATDDPAAESPAPESEPPAAPADSTAAAGSS